MTKPARRDPVVVGKGKLRYVRTKISTRDKDGRDVDLHALRTTLGTKLARAGEAPQIAQRIMRHSCYQTPLKHYNVLGLNDTRKTIEELPGMNHRSLKLRHTGTDV